MKSRLRFCCALFACLAGCGLTGMVAAQAPALAGPGSPSVAGPAAQAAANAASATARQPSRHLRGHPVTSLDARLGRLSADLRLDAGQRSRIRPILESQDKEQAAVRHAPGLTAARALAFPPLRYKRPP